MKQLGLLIFKLLFWLLILKDFSIFLFFALLCFGIFLVFIFIILFFILLFCPIKITIFDVDRIICLFFKSK